MVRTVKIIVPASPPVVIAPPSAEEATLISASIIKEELHKLPILEILEDQKLEGQIFKAVLHKAVIREMVPIINALIARAKEGDIIAVKEILDRILGKSIQPLTGEGGGPIQITWVDEEIGNEHMEIRTTPLP